MHYYQFNIGDWGLGTSHLSLEEEAIYLRLINHYYDTEKPIPEETQWVIRRLRLGQDAGIVESVLTEFFTLSDKGWEHKRCEEMLKAYRKTVKKNRENGKKGGRPRKDAASSDTQEKPTGLPLGTQSEPTGNPNQELLTNNHKPVTSNQVKDKTVQRKRFTPPVKDDVYGYLIERGLNNDQALTESEKYMDHYLSNGWKVGRNPMKDWKAAVRNWTKGKSYGSHQQASQQPGQIDHDDTSWGDEFLSQP
jgi:uncharacterized protein YdaU (DUF1376 family)